MRRYFMEKDGEPGTDENPEEIALSDEHAAMLRAVTMAAGIRRGGGLHLGFAVEVGNEPATPIGQVPVAVATTAS